MEDIWKYKIKSCVLCRMKDRLWIGHPRPSEMRIGLWVQSELPQLACPSSSWALPHLQIMFLFLLFLLMGLPLENAPHCVHVSSSLHSSRPTNTNSFLLPSSLHPPDRQQTWHHPQHPHATNSHNRSSPSVHRVWALSQALEKHH